MWILVWLDLCRPVKVGGMPRPVLRETKITVFMEAVEKCRSSPEKTGVEEAVEVLPGAPESIFGVFVPAKVT